MNGAISSIKLIFVGIFFVLCIAVWGYQVLYVWPKQKCERENHGWFEPRSRECGRVIYIPNVTGRVLIPREAEPTTPDIAAIAVLDLTEPTHGNASGIGLANVTTWRAAAAIDWTATYMNCLTSGIFGIARVGLPIVMADDRRAISVAVNGCAQPPDAARIVFATDTLHVNQVWVAPWMADEIVRSG